MRLIACRQPRSKLQRDAPAGASSTPQLAHEPGHRLVRATRRELIETLLCPAVAVFAFNVQPEPSVLQRSSDGLWYIASHRT